MKKKLLDRRGAAIELAIMMMVFSIFITTIVLTTALLQNSHKAKAELGIKQDIFLEQLGEDFVDAITNGKPITGDFWSKYEGVTVPDETIHTHQYGDSVLIAQTCEGEGYSLKTCISCGETMRSEVKDPLGHNIQNLVVYDEPTCNKSGKSGGYCERCKQNVTIVVSTTPHNFSQFVRREAAKCTEDAYDIYSCVCGQPEKRFLEGTGGHRHNENDAEIKKVEPTCTENGAITYICTVCQKEYESDIEAKGHNFQKIEVEGLPKDHTKEKCSNCGEERTISNAHSWDTDGQIIKDATCTEEGILVQQCTAVGCTEKTESVIPAKGHSFDEDGICSTCGGNKVEIKYNLIVLRIAKDAYELYMEKAIGDEKTTNVTDVCLLSGEKVVLKITISQLEGIYTITEWSKK